MIYSVWANGQLIGETRLELRPSPRRRTGVFLPTAVGMGVLPTVTRGDAAARLEVRDPSGDTVRWESVAITDVQQMIAAARARKPTAVSEASAVCGPIRFVISVTEEPRDGDPHDQGGDQDFE